MPTVTIMHKGSVEPWTLTTANAQLAQTVEHAASTAMATGSVLDLPKLDLLIPAGDILGVTYAEGNR